MKKQNNPETRLVNCIAIDDCPFPRTHRGDVRIVATVFARLRLDGIMTGKVRKDGTNATEKIIELIKNSKFFQHCNIVMLQGIALGGFNVIDVEALHESLGKPVIVVARRLPDYYAIKEALLNKVRGGRKKWSLIEGIGPMEKCHKCYIQRIGLTFHEARKVIEFFTIHGNIPEPLRVAHLIASALDKGISRGRA